MGSLPTYRRFFGSRAGGHFDSVGFTIGAQSVPQPPTLVLGGTAIAVGAGLTWSRRRHRRGGCQEG